MPLYTGTKVWKLIDNQTLYGIQCQNVYFFGSSDSGANAHDLNAAFDAAWLPNILDFQSEDLHHVNLDTVGVKGVFDFDTFVTGDDGAIADTSEPVFVAWSFRQDRAAANERHGYKRYAGVPDSGWIGGDIDSTILAALNAFATELNDAIAFSTPVYVPLIQRRFLDKVELDEPEYYTYSTASFRDISTQSTRKP
jgi:hypothetical protein